jgi:hypothetical protein
MLQQFVTYNLILMYLTLYWKAVKMTTQRKQRLKVISRPAFTNIVVG